MTVSIINNPTKTYDSTLTAFLTAANFSAPSGTVGSNSFTLVNPPTTGSYNVATAAATSVTATLTSANFTAGTGTVVSNYALPTSATGPGAIAPLLSSPGLAIADYANDATPATATLATFMDIANFANPDSASINWGDTTTTSGTIVAVTNAANTYTVQGSHTYSQSGVYQVQVTIMHGSASTVATLNADIGPVNTWSATSTPNTSNPSSPSVTSMNAARENATATLLPGGQVLVAGGFTVVGSTGVVLSSAELYNPATGTWSSTGSLNTARDFATATLLPNGQVLVAGGQGSNGAALSSAELYNPATGAWSSTGSLNSARYDATATLLPNGQVLVAGGAGNGIQSSAELYNPVAGTWSITGSLHTARFTATATMLANGQVLVAGGDGSNGPLASAELYNPATGTWSITGSLNTAHENATATLLASGQVLVVGDDFISSDAELYNPATGAWATTGSLNTPREFETATLLPNGQVLVTGGDNSSGILSSSELYNPATGTWTTSGSLNTAREATTATLLANGQVLIAGGFGSSGVLASSELFEAATLRSIAVTPGNVSLSPVPTFSTFASTSHPAGLAFDASGNLYTASQSGGTVTKITPAGAVSTFASGLSSPYGVTFDNSGNLYVPSNGAIIKITPAGTQTTFASGFGATPQFLTFDPGGTYLYAQNGGNTIDRVNVATGAVTVFATGFSSVNGMAFSANGTLYVADFSANKIDQVTPAGVVSTFVSGNGLSAPNGLAFDAAGYLYVANYGNSTILKITPAGTVTTYISSGVSNPVGLAFDSSGNLYVANQNAANQYGSTISKITPTTEQYTAVGTYSDSSTQNITAQVSWSASPSTVVTITSTGLATGQNAISADQPTAYYQFGETSGTTAYDASGNNRNGTYQGGYTFNQPGPGSGVPAVALNGSSGYVSLPATPFNYPTSGTTSSYTVTVEGWFNTTSTAGGVILGQTGGGSTPGGAAPNGYVPAILMGANGKIYASLFWHGSTGRRLSRQALTTTGPGTRSLTCTATARKRSTLTGSRSAAKRFRRSPTARRTIITWALATVAAGRGATAAGTFSRAVSRSSRSSARRSPWPRSTRSITGPGPPRPRSRRSLTASPARPR